MLNNYKFVKEFIDREVIRKVNSEKKCLHGDFAEKRSNDSKKIAFLFKHQLVSDQRRTVGHFVKGFELAIPSTRGCRALFI